MEQQALPAHYHGKVELDLCLRCNTLWFDPMENLALPPATVLRLARELLSHHAEGHAPLGSDLRCPRCDGRLRPSQRLVKGARYEVWECPDRHGHLSTLYSFLRERGLLQPLTEAKREELRRQAVQLSCGNCGAPVDLARAETCAHCRSPIALLNVDAMAETLQRLLAEEQRKANPNPEIVAMDAALAKMRTERAWRAMEAMERRDGYLTGTGNAGSLIEWVFAFLTRKTRP